MQFQSTLPRRERRHPNRGKSAAICDFNPRSREGSDELPELLHFAVFISIHAPAKGATQFRDLLLLIHLFQSTLPRRERLLSCVYISARKNFNPRSREGSDQHGRPERCNQHGFQSTLPRRERHYMAKVAGVWDDFNPRSREGSDSIY